MPDVCLPTLQAALRAKEAGSTRFCMGAAWRGPTQVRHLPQGLVKVCVWLSLFAPALEPLHCPESCIWRHLGLRQRAPGSAFLRLHQILFDNAASSYDTVHSLQGIAALPAPKQF